jgi:hypothetical protein
LAVNFAEKKTKNKLKKFFFKFQAQPLIKALICTPDSPKR